MKKSPHRLQETALAVTRWIGSPPSIVVHTIAFLGSFALAWFGFLPFDRMLLILTTVVSLEAIYLAIFIQMTINVQGEAIEEVEQDIDEIQGDVDEIQKDVDEIQKDVDEIADDVDEIADDVDEIAEDVDEIQEDVEEMEKEDKKEHAREEKEGRTIEDIHKSLKQLLHDVEKLKAKK